MKCGVIEMEIEERERRRKLIEAKRTEASRKTSVENADLAEAFESLGLSEESARVAAGGRAGLREAKELTKTEPASGEFKGGAFPKSDYAYTPSNDPATWQLLLTTTPDGDFDAASVRAAVAALDGTNPLPGPGIADDDLPGVLSKVSKAWRAAGLGDLPDILTAEARAFAQLGTGLEGLVAAARGRSRRI